MIYLGHKTNTFDFYTLKTLKYHNFLNIYPSETKLKLLECEILALLFENILHCSSPQNSNDHSGQKQEQKLKGNQVGA